MPYAPVVRPDSRSLPAHSVRIPSRAPSACEGGRHRPASGVDAPSASGHAGADATRCRGLQHLSRGFVYQELYPDVDAPGPQLAGALSRRCASASPLRRDPPTGATPTLILAIALRRSLLLARDSALGLVFAPAVLLTRRSAHPDVGASRTKLGQLVRVVLASFGFAVLLVGTCAAWRLAHLQLRRAGRPDSKTTCRMTGVCCRLVHGSGSRSCEPQAWPSGRRWSSAAGRSSCRTSRHAPDRYRRASP